eukprot:3016232-Alexandrium_andersonii.AAC.1
MAHRAVDSQPVRARELAAPGAVRSAARAGLGDYAREDALSREAFDVAVERERERESERGQEG